ncbi:Protein IMPACT-A [Psilocybe cubensis]|uniref:Impact N-terminal domain-containing protein n=2 Tax=Psilocybe cubensis TaxID=181762 RepID=A0A8H7Y8M0_PSICU|nr:Protein IMPACT-A [Psilocybe cubensis]KAH9485499.1 Protein IMPACT-A [Psilocybe cubensis]
MSQAELFLSRDLDGSLDAFISHARPQPDPIATSQEVRDRGSLFVANIYRATTPEEARARLNHLKHTVHRQRKATHEISAWRCMVLKQGKSGLSGPEDFELVQGSKDDGESWAGGKVLKVMEDLAVIDAVVIVSRWYGGIMLGPVRFTHIETCATEVCKEFKRSEELQDCITTLRTLDDLLSVQREKLAALNNNESSGTNVPSSPAIHAIPRAAKKSDYSGIDLSKAKRLIHARENAIKGVKALISKKASMS